MIEIIQVRDDGALDHTSVLQLERISLILIIFLKMRLREFLEGDVRDKGKSRMAQSFYLNNGKMKLPKKESLREDLIWAGGRVENQKFGLVYLNLN